MIVQRSLLAFAIILLNLREGLCVCYFPGELQGVWATQRTTSLGSRGTRSPISYQEVTIESDLILQWGVCHARADNNVILMDSTGGSKCYRCVYMNVASPKVVQVWTMGLETCYTSEEAALSTCPPARAMASRSAREIMLYKVRSAWGEPEVTEVECPLNGRFSFTYRRGLNGLSNAVCDQPTSEFSNCPYGFGFSVIYRECSFATPLRTGLQCLGSWLGEDNNDYLAVMDTSVEQGDDAPQFKCGMFREEAGTGRVFLSFSEDSTCTNSLTSPTDGYETYQLTSMPSPPLPPSVSRSKCEFPKSLMGHWHHTYVADDTVVFKDYRNFKTYSARCVSDLNDGERYIVYARTHCGDWTYNCLWLKRRSANVLEFMLGLYPRETFDDRLCDVDKFGDLTSWTTQGKSLPEEPTTCPIIGNYMGELPDANGICAQLYSDCKDPQIMFYTVSDCSNSSAIYEREDLPGPTSEAGPWLPPEQKVSTGAVFTIVEDPRGRGRRQAGGGRMRVANARTTTISWLWGSSTTSESTTTASSTTTTTTTTPSPPHIDPLWRRPPIPQPPPVGGYPSDSREDNRRINPDPFLEDRRPPSNLPRPELPRQDGYDSIGFWPGNVNQPEVSIGNRNQAGYSVDRDSPSILPPLIVPGPRREMDWDDGSDAGGVPGRATWVPGAPPGFNSQSSSPGNQPDLGGNGPSFSQNSPAHVSPSSFQTSTSSNSNDLPYLPAYGANRQPLKQGMHEREDDFAWDNRHNYPIGHWLTADPQRNDGTRGSLYTESSVQADRGRGRGNSRDNSRDSRYSITDNRKLHENARGQDASSWASWPVINGDQSNNPFPSDSSALSGLGGPLDLITPNPSSSSSWRPFKWSSSHPLIPSPDFTLKDESERTNHRQPGGVGFADSDGHDQVRENNNSGSSEHRPTVPREPSGRGFWASSQGDRNDDSPGRIGNGDSGFTDTHTHSLTPHSSFNRSSGTSLDRPSDIVGDPLSFVPIDIDIHTFGSKPTNKADENPTDSNLIGSNTGNRQGGGLPPSRHGADFSPNGDTFGREKFGGGPITDKPRQEPGSRGFESLGGSTTPQRKGLPQSRLKAPLTKKLQKRKAAQIQMELDRAASVQANGNSFGSFRGRLTALIL